MENKENIFKSLKNDGIKIEDARNYGDEIQKFLFWLDGVKEFAPKIISEFCDFITQCIKNYTHPVDILLITGSFLNDLYIDNVEEIKMLQSIKKHIELIYPDNELNTNIESLDTCQTIRLGIIHWLKIVNNNKTAPFIEPPTLTAQNAVPTNGVQKVGKK